MVNLYVIGNGFDIFHKLNTHYFSYGIYLSNKNRNLYDHFLEFFGLPDVRGEKADYLWSHFESKLAELDTEGALDRSSGFLSNPGSSDFRDRDWGAFAIEIESFVSTITDGMNDTFCEFIKGVQYPELENIDILSLDTSAKFLNFNYTDTLSRYYDIDPASILHIHGKVNSEGEEIVLGHGVEPDNFITPSETPPDDLSDEGLEKWREYQSDQYDHSFELGKDKLQSYFKSTYKNTDDIISENETYFCGLSGVSCVYILGHSLSDIDAAYFKRLVTAVRSDTLWNVSYYKEYEKEEHIKALIGIGVERELIKLIKLQELSA